MEAQRINDLQEQVAKDQAERKAEQKAADKARRRDREQLSRFKEKMVTTEAAKTPKRPANAMDEVALDPQAWAMRRAEERTRRLEIANQAKNEAVHATNLVLGVVQQQEEAEIQDSKTMQALAMYSLATRAHLVPRETPKLRAGVDTPMGKPSKAPMAEDFPVKNLFGNGGLQVLPEDVETVVPLDSKHLVTIYNVGPGKEFQVHQQKIDSSFVGIAQAGDATCLLNATGSVSLKVHFEKRGMIGKLLRMNSEVSVDGDLDLGLSDIVKISSVGSTLLASSSDTIHLKLYENNKGAFDDIASFPVGSIKPETLTIVGDHLMGFSVDSSKSLLLKKMKLVEACVPDQDNLQWMDVATLPASRTEAILAGGADFPLIMALKPHRKQMLGLAYVITDDGKVTNLRKFRNGTVLDVAATEGVEGYALTDQGTLAYAKDFRRHASWKDIQGGVVEIDKIVTGKDFCIASTTGDNFFLLGNPDSGEEPAINEYFLSKIVNGGTVQKIDAMSASDGYFSFLCTVREDAEKASDDGSEDADSVDTEADDGHGKLPAPP